MTGWGFINFTIYGQNKQLPSSNSRIFNKLVLYQDKLINDRTLNCNIRVDYLQSGSITVSNIKIEEGDKETPYMPHLKHFNYEL